VALLAVGPDHVRTEPVQHLPGHALGGVGPDVDHLVVALAVGDQALLILLLDLPHLVVGGLDEALLVRRDLHVADADRDAGAGRVLVAEGA
jgi:hypothetical protein